MLIFFWFSGSLWMICLVLGLCFIFSCVKILSGFFIFIIVDMWIIWLWYRFFNEFLGIFSINDRKELLKLKIFMCSL